VLHKWLAVVALAAAGLHDMIDAEMSNLGPETARVVLAETSGEIALNGLLLLGFATIIPFIPYNLWRLSHKFIGAFFAMAAFHFIYIRKPFEMGDPVGLYVGAFCLLGVVCYVYMLLFYGFMSRPRRYVVEALEPIGDVLEITLSPVGRGLKHRAGQFAFVNFDLDGMSGRHPFTLSGAPRDDRQLKVAIKALGDYTSDLHKTLRTGVQADLRGPFGGFTRPKTSKPQLWVAGGIGITPFLSWLRGVEGAMPGPVWLYYCVSEAGAPFVAELEALATKMPNLHLKVIVSGQGRLTGARIEQDMGAALRGAKAYFCGPNGLREALENSVPDLKFHAEAFEIRSGIGVRKASAWVWKHIGPRVKARLDARRSFKG